MSSLLPPWRSKLERLILAHQEPPRPAQVRRTWFELARNRSYPTARTRWPSRAEIAAAVSITCGMKEASAFFDSRLTGPASPIAATTSPASLRIGAAMQRMPISLSSSSIAQPRWRTPSSTFRNACRHR